MDDLPHKTPVSTLHEICAKNNIMPEYQLLEVVGTLHEPVFQYRITLQFNGQVLRETGNGRSKKEAKQDSARAMLRAMEVGSGAGRPSGQPMDAVEASVGDDVDLGGNPVRVLQELCSKMKLPTPICEVYSQEGVPRDRLFFATCKVGDEYVVHGQGKSKKISKRRAAHQMAEKLRTLPDSCSDCYVFEDDDDGIMDKLCKMALKDDKAIASATQSGGGKVPPAFIDVERVSELYTCQIGLSGSVTDKLKNEDYVPPDPESFLEALATEQNFKTLYIEYDEMSTSGEYQCLIQVTTDPPLVFIGVGDTKAAARTHAATDTINSIRLMIQPV